jgi:membrane-bound metal-dependent hydrolase YbcI (DUF457 family)
MRFYTHIPAGLLLYTLLVWIFGQPYTLAGVLIVVLFSVLPDLIDKVTGEHRGWGHSAIWLIPIVAFFFFNPAVGLACFSAFSMHTLLDAVTKKGVPFLYPFSKTRLVMPKKEKSRIQTGSKQETALCVVIVLLLIPLTFCVLCGVPGDLFASASSNSTKLNKTGNNSTKGSYNPYTNLRNSTGYSGYSKGSSGTTSGSGSLTKDLKSSSSTPKNTNSTNSTSEELDQGLINWLNQDLTNNNQTTNSTTSTNDEYGNTIADVLVGPSQTIQDLAAGSDSTDQEDAKSTFFSDLQSQFDNLVEGVPYETNSTDSDQSMFDFDGTTNPDAEGEESSDSDQLGLMLASAAAVFAGGGLVGKV